MGQSHKKVKIVLKKLAKMEIFSDPSTSKIRNVEQTYVMVFKSRENS